MAVKVEFKVYTSAAKEVYIVGSVPQLGMWDASKAVELKYDGTCFSVTKLLEAGGLVEYKVLAGKSWDKVEKGYYGSEVENHIFTPTKGEPVVIEIFNFAG